MKKIAILITVLFAFCITCWSQDMETTKPLEDTEIARRVAVVDIEGKVYDNMVITMKSVSVDMLSGNPKVKVTVTNEDGKKIYKRTFKNSNLYMFSDGQVQVGQPKFSQLVITKSETSGSYIGVIREKEGVY